MQFSRFHHRKRKGGWIWKVYRKNIWPPIWYLIIIGLIWNFFLPRWTNMKISNCTVIYHHFAWLHAARFEPEGGKNLPLIVKRMPHASSFFGVFSLARTLVLSFVFFMVVIIFRGPGMMMMRPDMPVSLVRKVSNDPF